MPESKSWPTSPYLGILLVQQGLSDNKGRGQSRRGLRPGPPNCKAVEGVRLEATVSLAHIPTFSSGFVLKGKFSKGVRPFYINSKDILSKSYVGMQIIAVCAVSAPRAHPALPLLLLLLLLLLLTWGRSS